MLKAAAFTTAPVLPEAGHVLGYAATAVSVERDLKYAYAADRLMALVA